MNSKKGFNLVELIAVIVLLSIIATLGITSFSAVKSKVGQREYNSLATTIKLAAERFSSETGAKTIFVQTLINKGLVQTDDETKQIYDPRDGSSSLNCQRVIIDADGQSSLTDDDNPKCNEDLVADSAIAIRYRYEDEDETASHLFENDAWHNKNIVLKAESTGIIELGNLYGENVKYSWISPLAPDEVNNNHELVIDKNEISDTYQLTVNIDGRDYIASQLIKIDKIAPIVSDFAIIDPASWNTTKTLTFKISDNASGIAGYFISGDGETIPTNWLKDKSGNSAIIEKTVDLMTEVPKFAETKKIYIWTIDNAGNISNNEDRLGSLDIEKIDMEAADKGISLSFSPQVPNYAKVITLTGSAEDSQSGLVAYAFAKEKLTKASPNWEPITITNEKIVKTNASLATEDGTYYFCVKDEQNNVACADAEVNSTDNKVDDVKIKLAASSYYNATLSLYGVDERSGIVAYCISSDPNNCTDYHNVAGGPIGIYDDTYTVNANGKYYLFIKDDLRNIGKSSDKGTDNVVNITTIDDEAADGGITHTYSPTKPTYAKTVTLHGTAQDTKTGLVAYAFSRSELNKNSSGWITIGTTTSKISYSNDTLANSNGTYYFCVKDYMQNVKCKSVNVDSVDNSGPTYSSGGRVSNGSVTTVYWNDVSSPVITYYYMTTSSWSPSASSFTSTSRSFSMSSCGTTYYVWAKAVDTLGNYTILRLGSYTSEPCCNSAVYQGSSCNSRGYYEYEYYNQCTGRYYTNSSYSACQSSMSCGSYGECQSNNRQSRTCTYYYGGSQKTTTDSKYCKYKAEPKEWAPYSVCTNLSNPAGTGGWSGYLEDVGDERLHYFRWQKLSASADCACIPVDPKNCSDSFGHSYNTWCHCCDQGSKLDRLHNCVKE